jgi:hypothetical protein
MSNLSNNTKEEIITDTQSYIKKYFLDVFSEEEFLLLFENAKQVNIKRKTHLVKSGERLDKIYYFAIIPSFSTVCLRHKDNTIISYLRNNCWIGLVELILYLNNNMNNKNLCNITLETNTSEIVYFEWDIKVMIL